MRTTNYNSKTYNSHRFNCLLSLEAYKILVQKAKDNNDTLTSTIENLIISKNQKAQKINIDMQKITNIINFNQKVYTDLNATMSNLNQIAIRLNIANLSNDNSLESLREDNEFLAEVKETLQETKQGLEEVRKLTSHFNNLLISKQKEIQ